MFASFEGCDSVGSMELVARENEHHINACILEYFIWLRGGYANVEFCCAMLDSLL